MNAESMVTASTLNNGAVIVRRYVSDEIVVLCYWEGNTHPWVTWRCDRAGNAYWGRYFLTEAEAAADFELRVKGVQS